MPPFVRVNTNLQNHRKTARLCRTLNISIQEAIGAITMLWIAARADAPDGNLEQFSPDDVAAATGFGGEDGTKIEAAFVDAGFLERTDGKLLVHDWMEHNGSHIKEAERLREFRRRNGTVQERTSTYAYSLVEKEIEKEKKIDSKECAPRVPDSINGLDQGMADLTSALASKLSMERTAPRAPLMTRVRTAVERLTKPEQARLYQFAGWLSKQIRDDECLLRVLDDAIPRLSSLPATANLLAYYSKDGKARAGIEGHYRADAQDNESKHWKAVEWEMVRRMRAINGGPPR